MWIPLLLQQLNIQEMQQMGLEISAEDIYSVNEGSLKDAVVLFGGFCTGSVIGEDGLVLTNHHCGYRSIAKFSSVERDLLTDGFWAQSKQDEIADEDLFVTFIREIREVTSNITVGLEHGEDYAKREARIQGRIDSLVNTVRRETGLDAQVKPFFAGNEYYLFLTETFQDVRLVGAPPSGIGKFGGDTDNWLWPRQTGDFSIFRIYTAPDGSPAEYSPTNVPMKAKKVMEISLDGVEEGDFTMVYGFPARTEQFLTSHAVRQLEHTTNPIRIALRTERLNLLQTYMDRDDAVRIQYASEYAGIANGWKKWIGQNRGLRRLNTIEMKRKQEGQIMNWVRRDRQREELYGDMLFKFTRLYDTLGVYEEGYQYVVEGPYQSKLIRTALKALPLLDALELAQDNDQPVDWPGLNRGVAEAATAYLTGQNLVVSKAHTALLLERYFTQCPQQFVPLEFREMVDEEFEGNYAAYVDYLMAESILTDQEALQKLADRGDSKLAKALENDALVQLSAAIIGRFRADIQPALVVAEAALAELNLRWVHVVRQYREQVNHETVYPDANFTLRLGYGKVAPYYPYDGAFYLPHTTLDGVAQKYDSTVAEFDAPKRLLELHEQNAFGRYGFQDERTGELKQPVCFIATNHTSGGNSGSPVLNGKGQLVGVNFDRNWEGTMSDVHYDPDLVRNITCDIRYVLFVVERFANASHLLEEMHLTGGFQRQIVR